MSVTDTRTDRQTTDRWATAYSEPVRPLLSDRCPDCPSVCPVCNVGALWPNGWMDQDETWRGGRPRPRATLC